MKILVVVLVLIALLVLSMTIKNMKIPAGLGVNGGRLAPMPKSPNAVSSQTEDPEKRVDPFPFKANLADSVEAVLKALDSYGNITVIEKKQDYIHAVSTTPTMHYHDDIEFYFNQADGIVEFRSGSRIGHSDMGLNRERYEALKGFYDSEN